MKYLLIFFSFLLSINLSAKELSDSTKIFLLSCSPGSELYNTFGHTGIEVVDFQNNMDIVFNFGLFDFKTEGFYIKFLRGQLPYKLGIQRMSSFIQNYKREKRSIYRQELNLSRVELEEIYSALLENYKPENREYKYDFFFDNCATRSRDVFENAINIQYAKDESNKSYRNILDEYLRGLPWADFGIDLVIGSIADKHANQRNQMFIPDYLHDHIAKAHKDGEPLVVNEELLLDYIILNKERQESPFLTPLLLFGILLIIELLLCFLSIKGGGTNFYELYNKIWFFVLGVGGIVIAFMWFGTEHIATKANWNLLWLHPLYLGFLSKFRLNKGLNYLCLTMVLMALLGFTLIPQAYHLAFIPILLIIIIKLGYQLRKTKT